jgi:hypothetical protein
MAPKLFCTANLFSAAVIVGCTACIGGVVADQRRQEEAEELAAERERRQEEMALERERRQEELAAERERRQEERGRLLAATIDRLAEEMIKLAQGPGQGAQCSDPGSESESGAGAGELAASLVVPGPPDLQGACEAPAQLCGLGVRRWLLVAWAGFHARIWQLLGEAAADAAYDLLLARFSAMARQAAAG